MNNKRREILVYADWDGMDHPVMMGALYAETSRGKEIFSFEYKEEWLRSNNSRILDPDLRLHPGPRYLPEDSSNFGIFLDSAPDRWGRVLMRRQEGADTTGVGLFIRRI